MCKYLFFWLACGILTIRLVLETYEAYRWVMGKIFPPVDCIDTDWEEPKKPVPKTPSICKIKPRTNYLETIDPDKFDQFIQ